jgi:uncharacterized protein YciI
VELVSYSFVLLHRGPRAAEYSDEELEGIQAGHLAFLDEMRGQGHMLVAGPFRDQADETLRGLCIYRTTLEETRRLVTGDPAIQAGRLQADVMTWLTKPGTIEPAA